MAGSKIKEVVRGDTNHGSGSALWRHEPRLQQNSGSGSWRHKPRLRKWFVETQTTAQEVVRGDTNHGSGSGSWRHEPRLQIISLKLSSLSK